MNELRLARGFSLPLEAIGEVTSILGKRGGGKALALDTPLPTPGGWTTMGAVQVGDELFDECGDVCDVVAVSPVMIGNPCFRVRFDDGSSVVADAEHLWFTETLASRRAEGLERLRRARGSEVGRGGRPQCQRRVFPSVLTTVEMAVSLTVGKRGDRNHSIPTARAISCANADLPVDPYALGAWLGDGTSRGASITTMDEEVVQNVVSGGYVITKSWTNGSRARSYYIGAREGTPLHRSLRQLGVLGRKHIPQAYLRSSRGQRLALLAGLMDTDGFVSAVSNSCVFTSCSPSLADGVAELVVSLGWKVRRRQRPARLNGRTTGTDHQVRFRPTEQVFRLSRKAERLDFTVRQENRARRRVVTAVEPVASVPVRCVTVDSPSSLFLAGRAMIPTHNSNTAKVIVEGVLRAGVQVVVLDPVGHWYGLRSLFPIPVVGGLMGDIPLEPLAGKLLADVVVESGQSMVLDLSMLDSDGEMQRFAFEFAERLYKLKQENPTLMLLVLEEADELAPQDTRGEGVPRMVGAYARIAKRGRGRGLGMLNVTLRSAALSKNVLNQTDTLIAMQTTAPLDIKAIEEWVKYHAEKAKEAVASLPGLQLGEAWVWAPGRGVFELVKVTKAKSLDTSATPKPGEVPERRREMKPIDLDALGERMRATVERAKENDPVALRGEIAALRRKLAAAEASAPPAAADIASALRREKLPDPPSGTEWELGGWMGPTPQAPWPRLRLPEPKQVEVPAVTDEQLGLLDSGIMEIANGQDALVDAYSRLRELFGPIGRNVKLALDAKETRPADPPRLSTTSRRQPEPERSAPSGTAPASRPAPEAAPDPGASGGASNGSLDTAAQHFLTTLARHHPMRMTVGQLGVLARRKTRGGSFNTAMKQLRMGGYIEEDGSTVQLTQRGLDESGVEPQPMSPEEVVEQWRGALPIAARELFDVLVELWPNAVPTDELAERTGRQPRGGSWNTAVSTLVRNGLAEKSGGGLRLTGAVMFTA